MRDVVAGSDVEATVPSFDLDALVEVRDLGWDVRTGYLFESNPAGNLAAAVELGCSVVHPDSDRCPRADVVDAHDAGLEVVAWKAARTSEGIAAVRNVGVDGVIADRWDVG